MYPGDSNDATLPTVSLRRGRQYLSRRLLIAIAFHPDVSRIGESVAIKLESCRSGIEIGRGAPLFSRSPMGGPQSGLPIDDAYVSRRALRLQLREGGLVLARPSGASPVKVCGRELVTEEIIPVDSLLNGLPLALSNRVVLLLREVDFELPSEPQPNGCERLVGSSLYMRHLRSQVASLRHKPVDIMLTGETGTGKGEVARALHADHDGPFVALNMSTLTPGLAAATLFGAERGAYTGADKKREGYFQLASGGTLFMDEVGDTDIDVQPQLLRALEEREVQVVGGAVVSVDLRVIAATDVDLEKGGSFRSALRFRLARHALHLRPLREHLEDLGELLLAFVAELSPEGSSRLLNLQPVEQAMWADLMANFLLYSWPGNIRELRNACGEVLLQSNGKLPRVPLWIDESVKGNRKAQATSQRRSVSEFDDRELLRELERHHWEITATARTLGVSRSSLRRRAVRLPDVREASEIPVGQIHQAMNRHVGDIAAAAQELRISRTALSQRLKAAERDDPD